MIEQQGKLHGSERTVEVSQTLRGGEWGFAQRPFGLVVNSKSSAIGTRIRPIAPEVRSDKRSGERGPEENLDVGLSSASILPVNMFSKV